MKHKRHNFSPKVIKLLAERAMFKCSAPGCSRQTHKPNKDKTKPNILTGKAAHICAASPGGPRYDGSMSEAERTSIDNGIWLCGHHADLIDREVENHPAELLRNWGKSSDRNAERNFNEKLLFSEEVEAKVHNEIHKFVTNGPKGKHVLGKESELIKLADDSLNEIDPRLIIKTDVIDGSVNRKIFPKDPEKYTPSVQLYSLSKQQIGALENFFAAGIEPISFKDIPMSVDSPVFETLSQLKGAPRSITIFRKPERCKVRITLRGGDLNKESFSREAKLFALPEKLLLIATFSDDFTTLEMLVPMPQGNPKLTIKTDFSKWNGILLSDINDISEIRYTMSALSHCEELNLQVRLQDGNLSNMNFSLSNQNNCKQKALYLETVIIVKTIAEHFRIPVTYSDDLEVNNLTLLNLVYKCLMSAGFARLDNCQFKIRFEILVPIEQLLNQREFAFPIDLSIQGYLVPVECMRIIFDSPKFFVDGDFVEIMQMNNGGVSVELVEK